MMPIIYFFIFHRNSIILLLCKVARSKKTTLTARGGVDSNSAKQTNAMRSYCKRNCVSFSRRTEHPLIRSKKQPQPQGVGWIRTLLSRRTLCVLTAKETVFLSVEEPSTLSFGAKKQP